MSKRITDAKRLDIVHDYHRGLTQKEVAARNHVDATTVCLVLKKAGVKARDRTFYIMVPEGVQQLILSDLRGEENEAAIANRYNVCVATVNNIRKRHKLPPRVRRVSKEERVRALRLYNLGVQGGEIAKRLGIHKTTVYNILRQSQVRLRGIRKWFFDEKFFRARNETTAYWMGFLMADGSLHKNSTNSHRLTLSVHQRDLEHLQEFCRAVGVSDSAVTMVDRTGVNPENKRAYITSMATVVLNHTSLAKWLLPWGIVPRKTYRFVSPTIPKRLYPAFLRGWFDGDGCMYTVSGRSAGNFAATIVAHEERALRWYSRALRQIGYDGKIRHRVVRKEGRQTWWLHIATSKKDVLRLTEVLRASKQPRLARKWDKVLGLPKACFGSKKITPKMIKTWKSMYQEYKVSTPEIAKKTGFSAGTIYRHLKAEGVTIRGAKVKMENELLVLRLHDEGKSQAAIAKTVGISQPTVSDILLRNGAGARQTKESRHH